MKVFRWSIPPRCDALSSLSFPAGLLSLSRLLTSAGLLSLKSSSLRISWVRMSSAVSRAVASLNDLPNPGELIANLPAGNFDPLKHSLG